MVKEELIGGLRVAVSRGQKLQGVMQSFFNAGYSKEEIESAAKQLQQEFSQPQNQIKKPIVKKFIPKKFPQQIQKPQTQTKQNFQKQKVSSYGTQNQIKSSPPIPQIVQPQKQIVSSYETPKKKIDFVTILLIAILVILLGVLAAVFLFKQELVEFLNNFLE